MIYLLVMVITIIGFTLLGWFVNYWLRIQVSLVSFKDFMLAFLVGTFLSQALYAIVITRGQTINSIIILVTILVYWMESPQSETTFRLNWKLLFGILPYLAIFCLKDVSVLNPGVFPEVLDDRSFNALISHYINFTGYENDIIGLKGIGINCKIFKFIFKLPCEQFYLLQFSF